MAEQTDDFLLVRKKTRNSSSDMGNEKPPSKMASKDTAETTNGELKKMMLDLKKRPTVIHGPDMKTLPPPWGFLKTVIFGHHVI